MMSWKRLLVLAVCCFTATAPALRGQEAESQVGSPAPLVLNLKRAIELALENSADIQAAKVQARIAEEAARVTKSEFMPNLYAGSGAGYTYGIPETPGGRAPSVFSVTYTQEILNGPLRGMQKEQQEQARAQRVILEDTRNTVIARVAIGYFELVKVRHSLELLRKEKDSAEKIVEVTQKREEEGFELPVELTRAQLTRAQVVERILQLEGRQDELEVFLRNQLGLANQQAIEVTPEDLPGSAEQEGANLLAMATENSSSLLQAKSDVRSKEFRLAGEKKGYWPTLELVSIYSRLANFNNYTDFFKTFQPNNYNAGVQIQLPLFSSKTRANVALAQANLDLAKLNLAGKQNQVTAEVRQKSRRVRQADATKEVARLELQLSQQDLAASQSLFEEGKRNLRDVERARLDENEKWMAYLDASFQRQQAQVELLRSAGQLQKVLE